MLEKYIGRSQIPAGDRRLVEDYENSSLAHTWEEKIAIVSTKRARAFRHYLLSMRRVFEQLSCVLKPGRSAVFVLGQTSWNETRIPTVDLFAEIAHPRFGVKEHLWYPVKNRYMSYSRRNGASIDKEHIVVLQRKHDG